VTETKPASNNKANDNTLIIFKFLQSSTCNHKKKAEKDQVPSFLLFPLTSFKFTGLTAINRESCFHRSVLKKLSLTAAGTRSSLRGNHGRAPEISARSLKMDSPAKMSMNFKTLKWSLNPFPANSLKMSEELPRLLLL